jgi:hypothetical protein
MTTSVTELRLRLRRKGYAVLPLVGKRPLLNNWQSLHDATDLQIENWEVTVPAGLNTGALCRRMPALDIDITNPEAAEAVETFAREQFEEAGCFLVRVGKPPKRAIPFRTNTPFDKITVNLIAPNGAAERIELLCNDQQIVVAGIHPDTGKPYRWHGGEPDQIALDDLPYVNEAMAQALVDGAAGLLIEQFGYTLKKTRRRNKQNGGSDRTDWGGFFDNLIDHDELARFAMSLLRSGMGDGAAINFLRDAVERLENVDPDRKQRRLKEVPDIIESARGKIEEATAPQQSPQPAALRDVVATFDKWLLLKDHAPIYATLATVAANLLDGDPVWMGLIAAPSSAKTEILNALTSLVYVHPTATLTPAALLSGTPKRQRAKGAQGGLLLKVGAFGIILCKDFGSVLSMRAEAKAETLAALREAYDGAWTRHLGTDGGVTLTWAGKVGLIFGATQTYDDHYTVIGSLGDRSLLCRIRSPSDGLLKRAIDHAGSATKVMRAELAAAVAGLFASKLPDPPALAESELQRLDHIVALAVRLRAHVERDRYSREVLRVHDPEGPGRLGLCLERLLAGLSMIGVRRNHAMHIVERVALDSVPPLRRRAFDLLNGTSITTRDVAETMGLPTVTARRVLEEVAAQGLAVRTREKDSTGEEKEGVADRWNLAAEWLAWRAAGRG